MALCTSPEDLREIFRHPLVRGTWVDLGAGYGHTVLEYRRSFPDRRSIGVEWEAPRIEEARKLAGLAGLPVELIQGDLLHCPIPPGDTFFFYFPQGHVLDRVLSDLSGRLDFTLVAIESHGDFFSRLQRESWLELRAEIPLKSKRHHPCARLYRPRRGERSLAGLHRWSFRERHFLLKSEAGHWWGESLGLCASGEDYLLRHPPRTIREEDVVKIVTTEELSPLVSFLVKLRRMSGVRVETLEGVHAGPLRKISEGRGISVEFPSGQKVEWGQIQRIYQDHFLCYDSSSPSLFLLPAP